ncbi:MAG TPA: FG-GAP-like repeat-containing protein [Smithellaceae bacterium]|nr:FG-GAP-like repeat-containing protein [Smithellaceae bacterium]HQF84218.1 FG-GAP-like repeat-containing protein [Smithellaceae bacterium]HQG79460.1 FG-GAP-like repeat-containing protein [Smithellaceae bacterium]
MKKTISIIILLLSCLTAAAPAADTDKKTITVLPFSVHSAENIDYMRQGITEMLASRLSSTDNIEVTPDNVVRELLGKTGQKDFSPADVQKIGRQLKSHYVVWGSITKIGGSISIDGKLTDIAAAKSDISYSAQSQTLDEVIPKINDFSQQIVAHITGGSARQEAAPSVPLPQTINKPQPPSGAASREAKVIAGMKKGGGKGTFTSMINPEFINATDPVNRRGFWMSQEFRQEFVGMAIGDVNNDGRKEIVIIDRHNIFIYRKEKETLVLLKKIAGKSYDQYISVDVADINKDGIPEIIVTSLREKLLNSFVLQYKDGEYKTIASNIRFFLRVIDTPSGMPMLLGQSYGFDKVFHTQIYEIVWRNGKYTEGEKQAIPLGLSIYGLAIEDLGPGMKEKIIALDELDYLLVLTPTHKTMSRILTFGFAPPELLFRSDEVYGGSNNYIANIDKEKLKSYEATEQESAFANQRILAFDTNGDGKKELIMIKNLSSVGRILKKLKLFTSSEIYNLEWDGIGLAENWHTKKINGYVADYAIVDLDNDGKPKLVLALVKSVGAAISDRSVVVIYELKETD